jgi:hypothetical protein
MKVSRVGNIGAMPTAASYANFDSYAYTEPAVPGWIMLVDNLFV